MCSLKSLQAGGNLFSDLSIIHISTGGSVGPAGNRVLIHKVGPAPPFQNAGLMITVGFKAD